MKIMRKYRSGYSRASFYFDVIYNYGFLGLFEEISNLRKVWSQTSTNPEAQASLLPKSSISHRSEYLEVCKGAVIEPSVFSKYKFNREYRAILEHVTRKQGDEYLKTFLGNSAILQTLRKVSKKEVGGGYKYSFDSLGKVSPTQLRYSKILQDLEFLFGTLNGLSIAEIGVGNGGQAIQILTHFQVGSYHLIDLPDVEQLAQKNVSHHGLSERISINSESKQLANKPDLVISNYAFSELSREIQIQYFEEFIRSCPRGYFLYNDIAIEFENTLRAEDFSARIPGAEIFKEVPNTFPRNVLVAWGHNQDLPESLFVRV